jgi:hypothetical protein
MNTTLTGLFTLECIMKIFSFGFRVCRSGLGLVAAGWAAAGGCTLD